MGLLGSRWSVRKWVVIASLLVSGVLGEDILETSGFTSCVDDPVIKVDRVNIRYNNDNKTVTFDVAGSSARDQNVSAVLDVMAYGNTIYSKSFNPCDEGTFVERLCPVPEGPFSAWGSQQIPGQFADMVPGIAFQIPDIAAQATLKLKSLETDEDVACIQSHVTNGKTANVPAVSFVAAGIAGAALLVSGASAIGSAVAGGAAGGSGGGGSGTMSPSFTEVMGWFQGLAMNGMMSVNYPPVYRSFTKNFAFSTGMIPWEPLQSRIDEFRAMTGGNLTNDSVEFLNNATLVFPGGSTGKPDESMFQVKRAFDSFSVLAKRQFNTGFNTTSPDGENGDGLQQTVSGIQAFANQLRVPGSDVFMTVLLIIAIVIAAIAVFILLFKVILEVWALWGNFPKGLAGFRKHYWGSIARAITALIFVLYGIWVLYCVFQFTRGDSWAATTLAAVTLAVFTGILVFFSWKIWSTARKLKEENGDTSALYEEKSIWVKYSLFYDSYQKQYWWLFVPLIVYMAAKGCVLAAADGSGRAQTISVLIVEAVMLGLLLWSRPYERKSGNVVNILIQVVRVLSVVCILVFVEEFGIRQTTQTIAGVVLIAIQSTLTVVLVVLIAWHAIEACCRENPHRKRRKQMEKMQSRDMDDLTPLDARNSLLLGRPQSEGKISKAYSHKSADSLDRDPVRPASPDRGITRPWRRPGVHFSGR
ncbi:Flavin carrier protein-like protein [Hapsidospora chrysogenum ATCC 11550]|uniref:Flavin carrier protein-like protein n=1 Tax=Hapsidospora chrysogenum (strain ATCC 11550 / CBS 779.69 / DSM 880 / IAM 14645 / JCM 23072 / IMI 49137) TaxID=857340 RepID=A0A086TD60_HAPC1|nr:Flavin carrier protein-like protein [Hapsidospora chrysogenum ATCC 11550]